MLRVLVVEDDQDSAATLSMLVRLWGHEVAAAANGLRPRWTIVPSSLCRLLRGLPCID
jgi:CheY-like chemotaxis protein